MTTDEFSAMSPEQADNYLVDHMCEAMTIKLAKSRLKGRAGWNSQKCNNSQLWSMLLEHVEKGDPVDVINFAAMILVRTSILGERA